MTSQLISAARQIRTALVLLTILSFMILPATAAKLVALSVGVADYHKPLNKLPSPVKDANIVAETLQSFGFQVYRLLDPDIATFQRGIVEFLALAKDADAVVLFYSGHGAQVNGENYFLPLDGNLDSPEAFKRDYIAVSSVVEALDQTGAKFKFVVLDACRNNPFVSREMVHPALFANVGLAEMRTFRENTLISFASAAGQVSIDAGGSIGLSLYTAAFVDVLRAEQRIEVHDLTTRARSRVVEFTRASGMQAQLPFETGSMLGRYYFDRTSGGTVREVTPEIPAEKPRSGFVFSDSDRRLQPQDLAQLSPGELRIARNEIFARRGRTFDSADLRQYFSQFSWYRPISANVRLNDIETANVALIRDAERTGVRPEMSVERSARDFIFPTSDRRTLTPNDLAGMSRDNLRIARNEIYARRGRMFNSADLRNRFERFSWYRPYTWNPGLNSIERANVALIQRAETTR